MSANLSLIERLHFLAGAFLLVLYVYATLIRIKFNFIVTFQWLKRVP